MSATANVMIRIGSSLGEGGLASIKAGWDMLKGLSNEITNTVKELDKFKVVLGQVDMEMVNYADSAAKGQVDTFALMQGLQRMTKAGVEVTSEQFKTLTVRAVDLAKATGEDATQAFEKLTTGISRGSSRALTEYGVRLKDTTDLQKAQKDAVEGLTKGFEDLTVELETDTERIYALGNAWGTAKGLIWDALTKDGTFFGDAIEAITDNLNDLNSSLSRMNDATLSYMFSMQGVIDNMVLGWAAVLEEIAKVTNALGLTSVSAGLSAMSKGAVADIRQRREAGGVDIFGTTPLEKKQGAIPKPQRTGGGGSGSRSGIEIGIGLSPAAQRWAETLGVEVTPDTIEWFEALARRMGGDLSMGLEGPMTERRQGRFSQLDYEKGAQNIEEKMAELINLEERRARVANEAFAAQERFNELKDSELLTMKEAYVEQEARLKLLGDEEYQEARIRQYQEEDLIYQAEREIYMSYEREQAIQFAQSFNRAWREAFQTVSAGANAARYAQDFLKQSWAVYVKNVVTGTGSLKNALKEVLVSIGIKIAIEEGWYAFQDFAAAASAFARRQYAKGAQLVASAAEHTALAVLAGGAAGVASRLGANRGGGSRGISSSSVGTPSYGGATYRNAEESREIKYTIVLDDSAGMFKLVQEENTRARIAGGTSFNEDEAA